MNIFINQTGGWSYHKKLINKLFRVIGRALPRFSNSEVSIALVDNQTIKRLNKTYRRLDSLTDVLSFAEEATASKIKPKAYLGEIIIAYPYARAQAKKHQHSLGKELIILLTHGFLHLAGFDHLNKKDGQKMKRLEETIIKKFEINSAPFRRGIQKGAG